jgi:hypothetical protein
MLPPMVTYKAQNLYTSWCERGPKGAMYTCSKSGWFGMFEFEKWFKDLLLPILKRKVGRKLLIGDNLAAHISPTVIDLCRENDIQFVCLPPNSTDKLQPLDVGIFGPLKTAWRRILTQYKARNPNVTGIQKTDFPSLLDALLKEAKPEKNLPAAFAACGLYPVNPEKAMKRIPSRSMDVETGSARELLDSSLGEMLEELRGVGKNEKPKTRGKKIKIAPGKSYTAPRESDKETESEEDEEDEESEVEEELDLDDVEVNDVTLENEEEEEEEQQLGRGNGRKRRSAFRELLRGSVETDKDEDTGEEEEEDEWDMENADELPKAPPLYPVGCHVAAMYDKQWYIAQVEPEEPENECAGFTLLRYMERRGFNQFVWGQKVDKLKTINSDIIMKVEPPIPVSSRLYGLPKDTVKNIENIIMVKWSIIPNILSWISCLNCPVIVVLSTPICTGTKCCNTPVLLLLSCPCL